MNSKETNPHRTLQAAAGLTVLAVLFVVSRYNYLLFHGLAELFAIAVAWSVFMLVWSTRRISSNDALLFVGIAYLFVGVIDLTHTLAYRGMGVFPDLQASNHATQLWIAARGIEAVALLLFPLLLGRRTRPWPVLLGCAGITAFLLAAIFAWGIFPDCYIEGAGLTGFKIGAEWVICAMLVLAIGLLFKRREFLDAAVWPLLIAAMAVTIAGELAFTLYTDVYGLSNVLGHLLKIVSFFLVYLALVRSTVARPLATIFQGTEQKKQMLAEEGRHLRLLHKTTALFREFETLDDTIGTLPELIADHYAVPIVAIERYEADRQEMVFTGSAGIPKSEDGPLRVPVDQTISGTVATSDRAVIELNVSERTDYRAEALRELGVVTFACVPLVGREGVIGTLAVADREERPDILDGSDLLQAIADSLVQEISRMRGRKALKESEHTLRQSLDGQALNIALLDDQSRIVYANRAWMQFAEQNDGNIESVSRGVSYLEVCDMAADGGDDVAGMFADGLRKVMSGTVPRFELEYPCHSPLRKRWFAGTASRIDADGLRRVVVSHQDITERKQAEEAIERRMTALTQPLDNPEGVSFEDLFNLEDIQRLQDQFSTATGVASIITDTGGMPVTRPSNFCRLCSDVIRKTDKGLTNCFKSDALLGKANPDGPTIQPCLSGGLWDAGAGISVGGRHIANWLIGQVRDETQTDEKMRAYAREIGADEAVVIEAFHEVPAMSREKFEKVAQALFSLASQLSDAAYRNVQQARFITERKEAEKEKEELQAQLSQAQKMESIGTMAGGVAHDFNNILYMITGNAELAMGDIPESNPAHANLEEIKSAGLRAAGIVKQLLNFSRGTDLELKPINAVTVIKDALTFLRSTIPSSIEIRRHLPDAEVTILADPVQINQILMNICTNASQAMEKTGGLLEITVESESLQEGISNHTLNIPPGEYLKVEVSDTGPGIDPEIMDRIFDPYFTTKDVGQGSGLGLAVVHGIVKNHHGAITVASQLGEGTTFVVYFPISTEKPVKEVKSSDKIPRGDESIIFVDDEKSIVTMFGQMLGRLGYEVVAKTNPTEALELFKSNPDQFDLIVTDMTMPQMSGVQLSKKLKAVRSDIPVIICTGHSSLIDEEKAKTLGIDGFVMKPIALRDIARVIRGVLDEAKS